MIAFDAATGGVTDQASLTYSHTCTGSNLILFVSAFSAGDAVSGVTYNSVAMTLIDKQQTSGGSSYTYLYYLLNPATGAHNVVVSTQAGATYSSSASYTGVLQSGQPDSSSKGTVASGTLTLSTTVVASNCWLVSTCGATGGQTAGTGTTQRYSPGTAAIGDSNGTVGTGSQSMAWTVTSGAGGGVIASFSPVPTAGGNFFSVL